MSQVVKAVRLRDDLQDILSLGLVRDGSDPVVPPNSLARGDVGEIKMVDLHPVVLEDLDQFLVLDRILPVRGGLLVVERILC